MAPVPMKRQRGEDEIRRPKKKIRVKRQAEYHSSSEDEDEAQIEKKLATGANSVPKSILKLDTPIVQAPVEVNDLEPTFEGLDETAKNTALNAAPAEDEDDSDDDEKDEDDEDEVDIQDEAVDDGALQTDDESDSNSDSDSEDTTSLTSSQAARTKSKRHDPSAFASSISKILDTKLTTSKRQDPVLSRSHTASAATKQVTDAKLEAAARAQLRAEKKKSLEKGRIKDVLGFEDPGTDTGRVQEEERKLKKTAQRGVVKLFNAVRAAQVKGEEGRRQAREEGVVGMGRREERVQEMSKEGFLELISKGGLKGTVGGV